MLMTDRCRASENADDVHPCRRLPADISARSLQLIDVVVNNTQMRARPTILIAIPAEVSTLPEQA